MTTYLVFNILTTGETWQISLSFHIFKHATSIKPPFVEILMPKYSAGKKELLGGFMYLRRHATSNEGLLNSLCFPHILLTLPRKFHNGVPRGPSLIYNVYDLRIKYLFFLFSLPVSLLLWFILSLTWSSLWYGKRRKKKEQNISNEIDELITKLLSFCTLFI